MPKQSSPLLSRPTLRTLTSRDLAQYSLIPATFVVHSRFATDRFDPLSPTDLPEEPCSWKVKNSDLEVSENPAFLGSRFDIRAWTVIGAFDGNRLVGGAIVAPLSPIFTFVPQLSRCAVLVDLRIDSGYRRQSLGRSLVVAAAKSASDMNCERLFIETQDTNLSASRLYSAVGCELFSVDPHGYGPAIQEANIVWSLSIGMVSPTN